MQQTSLDAYSATHVERQLRRKMVYDALVLGCANDRQLVERTGLMINQVTPRRYELVQLGVVAEDFRAPCPFTGRSTIFWRVERPWTHHATSEVIQ